MFTQRSATAALCQLELELIQPQMAQKPMLRGEVDARALRVRLVSREEVWASVGDAIAQSGPHFYITYGHGHGGALGFKGKASRKFDGAAMISMSALCP